MKSNKTKLTNMFMSFINVNCFYFSFLSSILRESFKIRIFISSVLNSQILSWVFVKHMYEIFI